MLGLHVGVLKSGSCSTDRLPLRVLRCRPELAHSLIDLFVESHESLRVVEDEVWQQRAEKVREGDLIVSICVHSAYYREHIAIAYEATRSRCRRSRATISSILPQDAFQLPFGQAATGPHIESLEQRGDHEIISLSDLSLPLVECRNL